VNGHVDAKNWEGLGYTTSEMLNGCGSMLPTKVKAGEIFEETLPVTVLYDLAKPGKYSIEVAVKRIDFDPVYLKSNKVTVTVTP
ncbi:MAG: hypothetical protein ABSF78_04560, partial [Candidatus Acidiferrales bacterium]